MEKTTEFTPEIQERIALVRAMDTICKAVNDEEIYYGCWSAYGVGDGDLDENSTDEEVADYTDDKTFAELMDTFLETMKLARKSGGLYAGGISSNIG